MCVKHKLWQQTKAKTKALPGILRTQEVHIKLKATEIRHLPLHSTLTSCQNSREYYSKIVTCIKEVIL